MRKLFVMMLTATVLLASAGLCRAASEPKPLVTVSFAGYDKLVANIRTVGELGGNPGIGQTLEMMVQLWTQGKGLTFLDAKQPWGAVVMTDGQDQMPVVGFLPVTDLKQLIELAKSNPQLAESIKVNGKVYAIEAGGPTIYVTQKGKWAFVSNKSENLAKAPADPLKQLGDLPQRYDLAIRASIKNLPEVYREQLLAQLRAAAEVGMQQTPIESEEEYAVRLNIAKQLIQQVTLLVNETDEVLLGWALDANSKSTHLDVEVTAQEGTTLAQQFAEIKSGPTKFAGLLSPGAALTVSSTGTLTDAQVAQANSSLANLRKEAAAELDNHDITDDEKKSILQTLDTVIGVLRKTATAKKTNSGLSLLLDPAAVTLLAGTAIVDGDKLDKAIGQLVGQLQKNKEIAKSVTMADEKSQDVHLYTFALPTPDPMLAPFVGDTLDVVVGVAKDKVFLAAGRDAAKTLKKSLAASKTTASKDVPPLRIALAVRPIVKFVSAVSEDEQVRENAAMLASLLEKTNVKDHVTLIAKPIPQGVAVRLEIEEGLLTVLGSMSRSMMPGGDMPQGGDDGQSHGF